MLLRSLKKHAAEPVLQQVFTNLIMNQMHE